MPRPVTRTLEWAIPAIPHGEEWGNKTHWKGKAGGRGGWTERSPNSEIGHCEGCTEDWFDTETEVIFSVFCKEMGLFSSGFGIEDMKSGHFWDKTCWDFVLLFLSKLLDQLLICTSKFIWSDCQECKRPILYFPSRYCCVHNRETSGSNRTNIKLCIYLWRFFYMALRSLTL